MQFKYLYSLIFFIRRNKYVAEKNEKNLKTKKE